MELIPVRFMFEGYPGLHDLDLQIAVYKVGEQCGLKEPKERLIVLGGEIIDMLS